MYLLLDENNIVRCMASEKCNLHKDKIAAGMKQVEAEYGGVCGDKYDPETKTWKAHPENYLQPTDDQIKEQQIIDEMRELAIESLKAKGKL